MKHVAELTLPIRVRKLDCDQSIISTIQFSISKRKQRKQDPDIPHSFWCFLLFAIKTNPFNNRGSLIEGSGAAAVNDLVLRDTWIILPEEDIRKHHHSTSLQHHDIRNFIPVNLPQFTRCLQTVRVKITKAAVSILKTSDGDLFGRFSTVLIYTCHAVIWSLFSFFFSSSLTSFAGI